jgi:long-chain fatty acid transport protein
MKKIIVTTALLAGTLAFAGGFRVSLQGVKQLAMAHTSAHAEDASVAFFNPAGISFIPNKLSIAAGGFGINSEVTYQNPSTLESYKTDSPLGTPIYFAAAYKITDKISVGLSATTPFGSTIKWEENWAGRDIIQEMELKAYYFQPMISFKLADWVSLGGSYIIARGEVMQNKAITPYNGSVTIEDKKAKGTGFSFGFYFQPNSKLDVSIAYRSPVDMKAENGTATFNVSSELYSGLGVDANGQDGFKATLPLVDEYFIGATYKVTPKWQISADFNYQGWDQYNALVVDFDNALAGNVPTDLTISSTPKNFKSTRVYRIGTQYMLTDKLAGRLGYYYDESPYEDKDYALESPSFDANVVTGGIGYKVGKFGIDLSGAYSFMKNRAVDNEFYNFRGQAKGRAYYFGLGLSYNAF